MTTGNKGRLLKMSIPYADADPSGYGIQGECLWVTEFGNDNYRLENQPLVSGLFYRDIVKAKEIDGRLVYQRLVIRADPKNNLLTGGSSRRRKRTRMK